MARVPLREAARQAGISERTARRYLRERQVPHDRGPKDAYLVDPDDLRTCKAQIEEERRERMRRQGLLETAPVELTRHEPPREQGADDQQEEGTDDQQEGEQPKEQPEQAERGPRDVSPEAVEEDGREPVRRRRRRRRSLDLEDDLEVVELGPSMTADLPEDLGRLTRIDRVLRRLVAALTLTRLPQDESEAALLAGAPDGGIVSVPRDEFDDAMAEGGLTKLVFARLGPGRTRVDYTSSTGVVLYTAEVTIPDYRAEMQRLLIEQRKRADEVERDSRRKRDLQELEFAQAQRERERARLRADQGDWARACADLGIREAARRIQWATWTLWGVRSRQSTAFMAAAEAASLRYATDHEVDPDPLEQLQRAEDPFAAELERVRQIDLRQLHEWLSEVMLARASAFYPAPPWTVEVISALEPWLPSLMVPGFLPWNPYELFPAHAWAPPPPLPPPPPGWVPLPVHSFHRGRPGPQRATRSHGGPSVRPGRSPRPRPPVRPRPAAPGSGTAGGCRR